MSQAFLLARNVLLSGKSSQIDTSREGLNKQAKAGIVLGRFYAVSSTQVRDRVIAPLNQWELSRKHIGGKRTLLVDDEESVRESTRMLLEELWDHEVTEAGTGQQALEQFQPGKFDLVITDFYMPPFPGNELAKQIKELAPEQRVLMITGVPQKLSGSDNPVDLILNKPFTLPELRQALERLFAPPSESPGTACIAAGRL